MPDRITHAIEIRAFGQDFLAVNGDALEVVGGILHINGRSVKEMARQVDQARKANRRYPITVTDLEGNPTGEEAWFERDA